jgi:Transposase domain (DUF772)
VPFNREQAFLLPPDLKAWVPEDDLAHFVVAAVKRVPFAAFQVADRAGGKPQYHPRLMLALLIYSYANGIFSSRLIERGPCPRLFACKKGCAAAPSANTWLEPAENLSLSNSHSITGPAHKLV